MKLAVVVLAHRSPQQLAVLLSALASPHIRVYLHIDARSDLAPFFRALNEVGATDATILRRQRTRWGGTELVDATLEGLSRAFADRCDYTMLISGQDLPLRSSDEMIAFIEEAGDRSYVDHFPLPAKHWRFGGRDRTDFYTYDLLGRRETCVPRGEDTSNLNWKGRLLNEALRLRSAVKPRRKFPSYASPFGGSQWWNLSRDAVEYVLRFVREHPDYRRYHEHTLAADEMFLHSILLGTDFDRDHEVVNHSLRFTVWPPGATHPRVLTREDLPELLVSEQVFARKFDAEVDAEVIDRLVERVSG